MFPCLDLMFFDMGELLGGVWLQSSLHCIFHWRVCMYINYGSKGGHLHSFFEIIVASVFLGLGGVTNVVMSG